MAKYIDLENEYLNMIDWAWADIPIEELKAWCERRLEEGSKTVRLDLKWGYYNDLDEITLTTN